MYLFFFVCFLTSHYECCKLFNHLFIYINISRSICHQLYQLKQFYSTSTIEWAMWANEHVLLTGYVLGIFSIFNSYSSIFTMANCYLWTFSCSIYYDY